jgi:hypothetical protein
VVGAWCITSRTCRSFGIVHDVWSLVWSAALAATVLGGDDE